MSIVMIVYIYWSVVAIGLVSVWRFQRWKGTATGRCRRVEGNRLMDTMDDFVLLHKCVLSISHALLHVCVLSVYRSANGNMKRIQ